jgi:hypothetical protein
MNKVSQAIRVLHMASMARSGETMILRALSVHPIVCVAGQLHDSQAGERRLRFFRDWQSNTINSDHEILTGLNIPSDGILLVKQGVWKHRWPFDGFVLARNPLSIYYSLITYDSILTQLKEFLAHKLGFFNYALSSEGNYERFYRWTLDIDKSLAEKYPKLSLWAKNSFNCVSIES